MGNAEIESPSFSAKEFTGKTARLQSIFQSSVKSLVGKKSFIIKCCGRLRKYLLDCQIPHCFILDGLRVFRTLGRRIRVRDFSKV